MAETTAVWPNGEALDRTSVVKVLRLAAAALMLEADQRTKGVYTPPHLTMDAAKLGDMLERVARFVEESIDG